MKITSILFLACLFVAFVSADADDCGSPVKNTVVFNGNTKICNWKIDSTNTWFNFNQVSLQTDDQLTIKTDKGIDVSSVPHNFKSIVVTKPGSYNVSLILSDNNSTRSINFTFGNETQVDYSIENDRYVKVLSFGTAVALNITAPVDNKVVVNFKTGTGFKSLKVDGFPYSNQNAEDIFSKNNQVKIDYETNDINGTVLFSLQVGYGICTDKQTVSEGKMVQLMTPKKTDSSSIKCIWVVKSEKSVKGLNLGYPAFNFNGEGDYFVVRKGGRQDSPVLAQIFKSNSHSISDDLLNQLSDSDTLYITYTLPYHENNSLFYTEIRVTLPKTPSFYNASKGEVKLLNEITNQQYLFGDGISKFIRLALDVTPSNSNLTLYNSHVIENANLLGKFQLSRIPNTFFSSNGYLAVIIEENNPITGKLSFTSTNASIGSNARDSDSISLTTTDIKCNQDYEWVIPSSDVGSANVIILNINQIRLQKESKLVLKEATGAAGQQIFALNSDASSIYHLRSVAPLVLPQSKPYVLVYSRKNSTGCLDENGVLLQASVSYQVNNYSLSAQLVGQPEFSFNSLDFPNNYSLFEKSLDGDFAYLNQSRNNTKFFVSFESLDLSKTLGHHLEFHSIPTGFFRSFSGNDLPVDFIVSGGFAVKFIRFFNSDPSSGSKVYSLGDTLSGSGFKINTKEIDDGKEYNNETGSILLKKSSSSIYIINTSHLSTGGKHVYLNFTVSPPSSSLKVYLTNSTRDSTDVVPESVLKTGNFSAPRAVAIIESTGTDQLTLNWTTFTCEHVCDFDRCILSGEICNGVPECKDGSDEFNCNSPTPGPTPTPPPAKIVKTGVNGFVVSFLIIPMAIAVGAGIVILPRYLNRFRSRQYDAFQDYSS